MTEGNSLGQEGALEDAWSKDFAKFGESEKRGQRHGENGPDLQHTARVLNAEHGGGEAAARLVAEIGPKATDARALAYHLYEIASQKGWAPEALIYNQLAQEWPKLEELASSARIRSTIEDAQQSLF